MPMQGKRLSSGNLWCQRGFRVRAQNAAGIACALVIMFTINVSQTLRSRVSGTVTDSNGQRIAGAAILAEADNSALKRLAVTDTFGEYQIDGLPPGEYRVTVSATNHLSVSYVVRLTQNSS